MSGVPMHSGSEEKGSSGGSAEREKSRIVTFRASSEEVEILERARLSAGARSLSGFARAAVLDKVEAMRSQRVTLSANLNTLSQTLASLDAALSEASRKIRRLLGPEVSERDTDASE